MLDVREAFIRKNVKDLDFFQTVVKVRAHFHVFTYLHISEYSEHKAVQNTFVCAIPIFSSTLENFGFFQNINDFLVKNVVLGAVSCGSQDH